MSSKETPGEDNSLVTKIIPEVVDVEAEQCSTAKRRKLEEILKRPVPNFETLKSDVYKHFTWVEADRQWKCNYCTSQYTHLAKGGSGSLSTHLRTKHPLKQRTALTSTKEKKSSLLNFYDAQPLAAKTVVEPITREKFQEKIINFMVETDQPFTIVESPSFRELIGFCSSQNEKCTLVSDTAAKEWFDNAYAIEKEALKETLSNNTSMISFILDAWTSANQHAFQGVIACWINDNWELCHSVIDLSILEGQHSGENLAEKFTDVLEDYNLMNKLLAVTTDNASNMKTMVDCIEETSKERMAEFRVNDHWVRCLAHIINLACKSALKVIDEHSSNSEIEDDMANDSEDEEGTPLLNLVLIRKGIMEIRRTPQRRQTFLKYCEKFSLPNNMLKLDVATRWNSTLEMLQRFVDLKEAYMTMTKNNNDLSKYSITENSSTWNLIDELIKFLKPFEEATKMLSQGHSPTISDAAAVYYFLFEHLEKYIENPNRALLKTRSQTLAQSTRQAWQVEAAKASWDKLRKYYSECDHLVYVVATILDPRYKLQWLQHVWEKEHVDSAKKKLYQLWKKKYAPNHCEASTTAIPQPGFNIASLVLENLKPYHTNEDELKRFLTEPVVNPTKLSNGINGALQWWKIHEKDEYPNLARMARDYLAVSATGVPVERLFSAGPDLISNRRHSLKDESIRRFMCLKQWIKNKKTSESTTYNLDVFQEGVLVKAGIKSDYE